jgi:hypothetical protein
MWSVTVPAGPADVSAFRSRATAAVEAVVKARWTPIAPPNGGWNNPVTGSGPEPAPIGWTQEEGVQAAAAIEAAVMMLPTVHSSTIWVEAVLRGDTEDYDLEHYLRPHVAVEVYRARPS